MINKKLIICLLLLLNFQVLNADIITNDRKISSAASSLLESASDQEIHQYWLYLNNTAFNSTSVYLTEKAKQRRAKVDPVNFLINEYDYTIKDSVLTSIKNSGVYVKHVSRWLQAVAVKANKSELNKVMLLPFIQKIDIVRTLKTSVPEIELVKPTKFHSKITTIFNYGASLFQNQFIKAVKLHRAGLNGKGVTIALFDTGFEINHKAFDSTNIIATYDFINKDITVDELECTDPFNLQQTFHGTFTFGIIGGYVPDSLIGVAPAADFILAKTEISCNGTEIKLEEDNWIAAAEWVDSIGADIINSSLGYTEFTDSGSYTFDDLDGNTALITQAADIAASKNILVVNSAGNDRLRPWGHIVTPADGDSVLAVGAVMPDSTLAAFSSPGPTADGQIKPDIVTLGVGVFSAYHQGGFASGNGTSFSAPLTAGGAALALEHDSTLTAMELLNLIRQTGSKFDIPDNNFGYGLYNATASADIIKFDMPKVIQLDINEFSTINVTTSGRTDSIPVLSALDLPEWMDFTDNQNGRGVLNININSDKISSTSIGLIADVGYFIDTSYYYIMIFGDVDNPVYVGPNPFNDSLNIFVKPLAGIVKSISIYNSSGEIVWEKVNNIPSNADVLIDMWNGRNQHGDAVTAGVYILIVNTDLQTHRVKLLKTN